MAGVGEMSLWEFSGYHGSVIVYGRSGWDEPVRVLRLSWQCDCVWQEWVRWACGSSLAISHTMSSMISSLGMWTVFMSSSSTWVILVMSSCLNSCFGCTLSQLASVSHNQLARRTTSCYNSISKMTNIACWLYDINYFLLIIIIIITDLYSAFRSKDTEALD